MERREEENISCCVFFRVQQTVIQVCLCTCNVVSFLNEIKKLFPFYVLRQFSRLLLTDSSPPFLSIFDRYSLCYPHRLDCHSTSAKTFNHITTRLIDNFKKKQKKTSPLLRHHRIVDSNFFFTSSFGSPTIRLPWDNRHKNVGKFRIHIVSTTIKQRINTQMLAEKMYLMECEGRYE